MYFFMGALAYYWRELIPWRWDFALLSLLALCVGIISMVFVPLFAGFGAYLTLLLGRLRFAERCDRVGNLSYGTYLYGAPITLALM